jgi:LuxR family maltose regulon positive regulatory protein
MRRTAALWEVRRVGILKTKLYRPTLPSAAVNRSELLRSLAPAAEAGFTLISAPAGFGKSTLVSAWLAQCPLPSTWLSLDHGDADLVVFVEYFIAAVQAVCPGACAETIALCKSTLGAVPAELVSSLINELDALGGEFIIVLDDYHVIDNQAVHRLVATLVLHPPRALHLVLCTRLDPPLPLARLRAQGKMVEVRAPDLRFSRDEAAAFFEHLLGYALDEATLATLDRYIEGWPVGLRLAALSLRRPGDAQELAAGLAHWQGHALDYLFHEVLSHIDPAVEQALVQLSVIDRFCAELYASLCVEGAAPISGAANGRQFIAWLQEANLFLVPLDPGGRWFRFHATFLDMLRRRSRKRHGDAERAELHRRAGAWFAAAGFYDEALDHAVAAGDFAAAAALVERARHNAINAENWTQISRWLSLLPDDAVRRSPGLLLCRAWLLQFEFRLGQLGPVLAEITALLQEAAPDITAPGIAPPERLLLEAELAVLRSEICCWSAQGEEAVAYALEALKKAPREQTFLRGSAYLYCCFGMQMSGRGTEGIARMHAALESEGSVSSTFTTRIMIAIGGSHWMLADTLSALRIGQQGLEVAQARHLIASQGWLCMLLSFVYYQRNDLAAAAACCRTLVEHPAGGPPMALGHTYLAMALIGQASADGDAQPWVDKAYALAIQTGIAPLLRQVESVQARVNLANGAAAAAQMWAHTGLGKQLPVMPVFLDVPQLTQAHILLDQGTEESLHLAAGVLREARSFVAQTHNRLHEIELLALEALLSAARGQVGKAHDRLADALRLAEPGGIVRTFVDLGHPLAVLLHSLGQQRGAPAYARLVQQAFSDNATAMTSSASPAGVPAVRGPGDQLIEPLTFRELEVLALLSERLSNKEIAQILVLSPHTVKAHVHHIFAKLQVTQRREAIARAKSLGLLSL